MKQIILLFIFLLFISVGYAQHTITTNVVGGTATLTTLPANEAEEAETVVVTISDIESGKQFESIAIIGEDLSPVSVETVTAGEEYSFEMPAQDVTVTVTLEDIAIPIHTITIALKTDNYGSETTWEVIETVSNTVLASGGPYTNSSAVQTIAPIEVDGEGCYGFYIYDSYGDGICCSYGQGYFKVYFDGELIGEGGSFASEASVMGMGSGCPQNSITIRQNTSIPVGHRIPDNAITNQPTLLKGKIINNGVSLNSFKVSYTINGGEPSEPTTINCNASMGAVVNYSIPYTFTEEGAYLIEVTISEPNGQEDESGTEDNTTSHTVLVNTNHVPRNVLLEHFTTAQCPNCPAATTNINNWLQSRPNVIWISHHAGYYTDAYTIPLNSQLLAFYNAGGSTYAPAIMLDRCWLSPDEDPGPVFFPASSYTTGLIDQRRTEPSFVSLQMEGLYNPTTKELDLTVSGEILGNLNGEPRISVYVIEDGLVGTQQGASGSYTHNHVVRGAISANFGDINSIPDGNAGTTFSKTYSYTMGSTWVMNNVSLVAFVADYHTAINDREVYNAIKMPLGDFVNVADNTLCGIKVFPNPASDLIQIVNAENAAVYLYSITGQLIHSEENTGNLTLINTSQLMQGTYILKIVKDNNTTVEKVVISR